MGGRAVRDAAAGGAGALTPLRRRDAGRRRRAHLAAWHPRAPGVRPRPEPLAAAAGGERTDPGSSRTRCPARSTSPPGTPLYPGRYSELYDLEADPGKFDDLWDEPAAAIKSELLLRSFDASMRAAVDVARSASARCSARSVARRAYRVRRGSGTCASTAPTTLASQHGSTRPAPPTAPSRHCAPRCAPRASRASLTRARPTLARKSSIHYLSGAFCHNTIMQEA